MNVLSLYLALHLLYDVFLTLKKKGTQTRCRNGQCCHEAELKVRRESQREIPLRLSGARGSAKKPSELQSQSKVAVLRIFRKIDFR